MVQSSRGARTPYPSLSQVLVCLQIKSTEEPPCGGSSVNRENGGLPGHPNWVTYILNILKSFN